MRKSFSFVELMTMQPQGVEDTGELCVARRSFAGLSVVTSPESGQPFPVWERLRGNPGSSFDTR